MTDCEYCGHETPDESFCTWCGAHRLTGVARPRWRPHNFAAHPDEHLAQPSIVTTLLPHLPRNRVHEFRWALLGGVAAVTILVATGSVVAAILTAAVLVPVLYLIYLYEVQVYRDEPLLVVGVTMVSGAALGTATAIIANAVIPSVAPLQLSAATGVLVVSTVLLPIIEEVVKPLPTLALHRLPKFRQTIDGLVFGVAAGLGFAAAGTLVNLSRIIAYEPLRTGAGSWLFPVLSAAVLVPLMQGSCTGAVVASIWAMRAKTPNRMLYAAGIPISLIGHVGFSFVSQVLANQGVSQATVLLWQAVVVAALLVYIRFLLHRALLDEAQAFGYLPLICPECHRHVEAAAFCPACGVAMAASPRTQHGGLVSARSSHVGDPGLPTGSFPGGSDSTHED